MFSLNPVLLIACLAVLTKAFVEPQRACEGIGGGCAMDCEPASEKGLRYQCWEFLNMTGYIKDWVAENGSAAGIDKIGFAQAYLAWSHKGEKTCNLITSNTCDAPPADGKYLNAQQFYTLYNIYAVYQFYNQYSSALTAGQGLAASKLSKIVAEVDPPVEHITSQPKWFVVLTTTLWYTSFLIVPVAFLGTAASVSVALIVNGAWAARSTPPLGSVNRGYTETANKRFTHLANIGSDLADIVVEYQKQILAEVKVMQDEPEAFLALTSPGGFSERIELDMTTQSLNIYRSLEQFVLSESLLASGIYVTKSVGEDPRTVPGINCPGFGPAGNCFTWYYHDGNTYSFHDPGNFHRDFSTLINFIWEQKLVDSMIDIFDTGSCSGKEPTMDIPRLDPKLMCMLSTKQCEYDYLIDFPNQKIKQYINCPNDKDFLGHCNDLFVTKYKLPLSYLGPLLQKGKFCR